MKFAPHSPAERLVDQLVLANSIHPGKARRNYLRRIMVSVAGKVADFYFRVRNGSADHVLDVFGSHWHLNYPISWRRASTSFSLVASRMRFSSISTPAAVRSPSSFKVTSLPPPPSKSARTTSVE